ncbi:hypothetical protein CCACVL1_07003 [Corchorus capsularis]|uniref:Uncharacterized protein n=1 Tax=Corchorus capsularis TaxID=210143 RepID=A0A1R3JAJ3_COCAP|nr:hypothetical protein CCACVL1_07003 [Corchorus capsularis]
MVLVFANHNATSTLNGQWEGFNIWMSQLHSTTAEVARS